MPAEHWHEWRRLEAVVNLALAHHNAWAVCLYDRHALTDERVDDLCATHPLMWSGRQHQPNDRYQDPTRFIAEHRDAPPDPVEQTTPAVELTDPSPAAARATVNGLTKHNGLLAAEAEGMILATSEAVANAILHGQPPIVLRIWEQPDRMTVTVTDTGTGPVDPFVGLLPPTRFERRRAGPMDQPSAGGHHPPPPPRRLHHPHDRCSARTIGTRSRHLQARRLVEVTAQPRVVSERVRGASCAQAPHGRGRPVQDLRARATRRRVTRVRR